MKTLTKTLAILLFSLLTASAYSLPKLNSYSNTSATIYLDFDGHSVTNTVWNGGLPIICQAPSLTDAQISEIFNRVAEDYRPFEVNITTDSTIFLAAPIGQRIRVIITPTSRWKPNVGGVAYIGSFTWGDDTPAFVFSDRLGPNSAKMIAECCSHESGHTLGLAHQSSYDNNCNLTETYNSGTGSGETGWAPIMGNSYYKNLTSWNKGRTPYGCNNIEDELNIITTNNGFSYRADDYNETMNASTYNLGNGSFNINAMITTNTDKDAFKLIFTQQSTLHIEATPFNTGSGSNGSNLDVKVMLYSESQALIKTFDPQNSMSITIDTTLKAGTYFFVISGAGNANVTNYASIGAYILTGFRGTLPINSVTLSGNASNNKHNLNWNIVSDEPIATQEMETSTDGIHFSSLSLIENAYRNFTNTLFEKNSQYYRLKVTSLNNQVVYSNVIVLRNSEITTKAFEVSTLVRGQISVKASDIYQFKLMDMNGRYITSGNGTKGLNTINIMNQPAGVYVLVIVSNNMQQSERIIKQ